MHGYGEIVIMRLLQHVVYSVVSHVGAALIHRPTTMCLFLPFPEFQFC